MEKLRRSGESFLPLTQRGSLEVEIYSPIHLDRQLPHARDEVYVILSGSGDFVCDGRKMGFRSGDFLFVAAGREHRFIDFSEDFSCWVLFFGPPGGEMD